MKIRLLFKRPENRTEDHFFKLYSHRRIYGRENEFQIFIFRLIPYSIAAVLLTYLIAAFALHIWVNRREFNTTTYWDMLAMPFDYAAFQKKRGEDYIRQGKDDLQSGRLQEGIMKIRIGLQKNPESLEARLFVAQLFYLSGRINQATYTLEKGFDVGTTNDEFLRAYFNICFESDQFEDIIPACRRLLKDPQVLENAEKTAYLETTLTKALLKAERYEEAYEISHPINLDPERTQRMVDAEFYALVNLERFDEAEELLKRFNIRTTKNADLVFLAIELFRRSGDTEQMLNSCRHAINLDLLSPPNHLRIIEQLNQAGLTEETDKAIDRYFNLFGTDETAMMALNNFASANQRLDLNERILKWVRSHNIEDRNFIFNLFYSYLSVGQWLDANALYEQIKPRLEEYQALDQQLINIGSYVIELKTDRRESMNIKLLDSLRQLRASIPFYLMLKDILLQCELWAEAQAVCDQGAGQFPDSKRIKEAQEETTQLARKYHEENTITPEVVTISEAPNVILDQIDAFIESGQWQEAEDLIFKVSQAKPSWWEGWRDDFEFRRLTVYMQTRDQNYQAQSTTLFLEKHPDQAFRLLTLAQQNAQNGNTRGALVILEQLLNSNPRNLEARALYKEITGDNFKEATQQHAQLENLSKYNKQSFALQELTQAIEEEDWAQADVTVGNILEANPAWLRQDRSAFDLLNLRLRLQRGDFNQSETLIRLYMGGDVYSARELMNLAQEYREKDMTEIADFIADQVAETFPGLRSDQ